MACRRMFDFRVKHQELRVCVRVCVQLDPESESTFTTLDLYDREAQLVIDYSSLAAELRVRHETSLLPQTSLRGVCL